MLVRLKQNSNADFSIFVIDSGNVTLVRILQLLNATAPISVTYEGMVISASFWQSSKALQAILVSEQGSTTCSSSQHP